MPYLSYITPNARELAAIAEEVCRQSHEQFTLGPLLSAEQRDRSQGHEHAASPHARSAPSSGSHGLGSSAGAGCGAAGAPCEQYLQELACCAAVLLQKGAAWRDRSGSWPVAICLGAMYVLLVPWVREAVPPLL